MRTRLLTLAAVALPALSCLYVYKLEVPETRQWSDGAIALASVTTANGAVDVEPSSGPLASADIVRRCWGKDREDAEAAIVNVVVTDTVDGDELRIDVDVPPGRRNYGADVDLAVPDTVALDLATTNGSVSVTGMKRGAAVSTSNGGVTALDTGGALDIATSNGAVTIAVHRGDAAVETSNGAVECDLAELAPTGTATFETSNGSVTLWLPEDVSASFDCQTSDGDITVSGFNNIRFDTSERTHKTGTIGSGAATVRVSTSNGDIVIRPR